MCSYGQRSMCADLLNSYERTYFLNGRTFCLQCRKCIRIDIEKIYRKSRVGRWRQWVLKAYKYRIYPNSEQDVYKRQLLSGKLQVVLYLKVKQRLKVQFVSYMKRLVLRFLLMTSLCSTAMWITSAVSSPSRTYTDRKSVV